MFITVKFGVDESIVLNPDCGAVNFMLHLKKVLNDSGLYAQDGSSELDLCDEQGVLKDIRKMLPMQAIAPAVIHKETYIPVKIQNYATDSEEITDYEILLSTDDKTLEKIKAKLSKQRKVSRRQSPEKSAHSKASNKEVKNVGNQRRQKDPEQSKGASKSKSKVLKHS